MAVNTNTTLVGTSVLVMAHTRQSGKHEHIEVPTSAYGQATALWKPKQYNVLSIINLKATNHKATATFLNARTSPTTDVRCVISRLESARVMETNCSVEQVLCRDSDV